MKLLNQIDQPRRILIVGDAGRGKTTFAKHASAEFELPMFSLDDILWKEKYSTIEDRLVAIDKMKNIIAKESWIIEGTTRYLAEFGFENADIIYHFQHRVVIGQVAHLVWRFLKGRGGTVVEFYKLILHSVYKRYNIGYQRGEKTWDQILDPYLVKTIYVKSRKEVRLLMFKD